MDRSLPLRCIALFLAILVPAGVARASGCGVPQTPGVTTIAVVADGRERPVHVYVPAGYDPSRPTPLLLNLHGSGSDGPSQFRLSGLAGTADRKGVIVASPTAGIAAREGFLWNVPGVPTVAGTVPGPDAPDDTGYLVAVIEALSKAMCVDEARVYSTGLSGGGRMTSWLACAVPGRLAGIAPVVGLRAGRGRGEEFEQVDVATCTPGRPVPVIAFAGARDRTNPIDGGEGLRWGYPMSKALQRWAAINGCRRVDPTVWTDARHYRQGYSRCRDGSVVEAFIDAEGAHSWDVANVDLMMEILLAHRRSDAGR